MAELGNFLGDVLAAASGSAARNATQTATAEAKAAVQAEVRALLTPRNVAATLAGLVVVGICLAAGATIWRKATPASWSR